MTWFETIAGNQRTWSRASARSSVTWLGAPTMHLSCDGSRPASSAALRAVSMIQRDDLGVGELDDHAVADAAGDGERLRAVARDPHRDLRQLLAHPLQLEVLVVPVDLAAVHELADHRARAARTPRPSSAAGRCSAPPSRRGRCPSPCGRRRGRAASRTQLASTVGSRVAGFVTKWPSLIFEVSRAATASIGIDSCQRTCESYVHAYPKPCFSASWISSSQREIRRIGQDGDAEVHRASCGDARA